MPSRGAAAEHGGGRQRRGVELVEADRGADEAEQDPGADHDEDGGVGELVEPEEKALLPDIELRGLLAHAHLLPLLPPLLPLRRRGRRRRRRRRGGLPLRHHHHLRRWGVQLDPAGLVPRLQAVLDAGGLGSGTGRRRRPGGRIRGRGGFAGAAAGCGVPDGDEAAARVEEMGLGGAVEEERERGGEDEVLHGGARRAVGVAGLWIGAVSLMGFGWLRRLWQLLPRQPRSRQAPVDGDGDFNGNGISSCF